MLHGLLCCTAQDSALLSIHARLHCLVATESHLPTGCPPAAGMGSGVTSSALKVLVWLQTRLKPAAAGMPCLEQGAAELHALTCQ